ncbi:MAG: GNAT family N-acetyltransferase [Anaerolineales bacterium]|nr:GNAT family N-acetyltransferase [Chloroflexota bacterium]MBL6981646.1 GNAT family N-acetyltransferase [Anaerolineales bacterium]
MPKVATHIAKPKDFSAIAKLIDQLNQSPQSQCIHSGTGESVESLIAEMEKWHESGEILFVIAMQSDQLIGAMGCEFESDGQRGWLRGPFSKNSLAGIASKMYDQLRAALPSAICRLDSFLNIENTVGQSFYEQIGFERKGHSHVYVAPQPSLSSPLYQTKVIHCIPLDEGTQDGFADLHDIIFPRTYYNGKQITEQLDDNHRVWVYVLEGNVLGYLYAIIEPWADEGYVEFLGVREDARGQGIGGALLNISLAWFFGEREMPQVGLTVSDENVNARGLYKRVGFRLKYTGVNHRLEWET